MKTIKALTVANVNAVLNEYTDHLTEQRNVVINSTEFKEIQEKVREVWWNDNYDPNHGEASLNDGYRSSAANQHAFFSACDMFNIPRELGHATILEWERDCLFQNFPRFVAVAFMEGRLYDPTVQRRWAAEH